MSVMILPIRFAPNVGGIETLLLHTLPHLRARGVDPVIVTGVDDDRAHAEVVDGLPVYRLPFLQTLRSSSPAAMLDLSRRLRDIEAEHSVSVRHVHGLDFNIFFVDQRHRRAPLPLVISVHGTLDEPFPMAPIALRLLRTADVVTAVSHGVADSITNEVPALGGRVSVIPNAVAAPPEATAWPARGPLLCAGRLDPQKGFDVAIDALARLSATRPDLALRIAGAGDPSELRRHAASRGLAERVHLLGTLSPDGMRAEMDRASVVLVPSRSTEGFSIVALEAAQAARPVVASRIGGLAETVEDGVTGVLVTPGDPAEFANAVAALLDDPGRAAAVGARARQRATRFDVTTCADAYAAIYRALGAAAEPSPPSSLGAPVHA
jgi:glycogen(starch) synthase